MSRGWMAACRQPSSPPSRSTAPSSRPRSSNPSSGTWPEMSGPIQGDSVATAKELYRALATGDRESIATLLSADFIGHAAEGLPLGMGGQHRGPEAMQRDLWWRIGKHFRVAAEPDAYHVIDDGRL